METSVTEIHGYPQRPSDFEEPLFATEASKNAVMEHFLESSWLFRASELAREREDFGIGSGAVHWCEEPVELGRGARGQIEIQRRRSRRCRNGWSRQVVVDVVERWREVSGWWDDSGGHDHVIYRLVLSDGAVVDVAKDRPDGRWKLVGIVD